MHINEREMAYNSLTLALSVALCLVSFTSHQVQGVVNTPGWVVPERVELAIDSVLNINCTINTAYFEQPKITETCKVEQLYFKARYGDVDAIYNIDPYIRTINETTILLTVPKVTEQEGQYVCMCGENGIHTSRVFVGTKPTLVEDFSCTSYDWDYMFCNFTTPKNSIITKYNVSFETQKNSRYRYYIDCNFDSSPIVNCNITSEKYKKFSEIYYFRLDIGNSLGTETQFIEVNNVERMLLARPGQNLQVLNKTESAICLCWDMPRRSNFIGGVLWQVHVTPDDFSALVRPMWRNNSSALRDTLCLTELPYAGYNYVLELRVRNNKTKSRWSVPLIYNFRTVSERPRRPPRITNGSFYVYSSEAQLTIYWEQLQRHEFNGDNFTYVISEYRKNGNLTDSSKIKVDLNSATIENWNQTVNHELWISSSNNVNTSLEASRLVIPPISNEDTRLRVPKQIRSVYHSSNSSYSLSWKAPENSTGLINYTVFWCNSKPALQSKCDGSIHFEHVDKDKLQYTTRSAQPPSLNMAVSANFEGRNTGMHWVICTRDGTDDLAKMEPIIDEVTNSSLTVKWSTERVCPAILSGYNLTYCQRSAGKADNCTTEMIDSNAVDYTIRNLEPHTYYGVKMLMYSTSRASKYSDVLINITGEASPSPPRQLEYANLTNTSVTLTWKPPLKANGVVRDYEGTYLHDNKTEVFKLPALTNELLNNEEHITFELSKLSPYTLYEISIRARTLYSSEPSNVIQFRTAVGVPSQPTLSVGNTQQSTTLEWAPPLRPAGRVEYYEVAISELNANNTLVSRKFGYVSSQQNRTCVLQSPVCTSLYRFHYQVRAVNAELLQTATPAEVATLDQDLDEDHDWDLLSSQQCAAQLSLAQRKAIRSYNNATVYRLYKSNWDSHDVSCSPNRPNTELLFGSIKLGVLVLGLIFAGLSGYRKYRKMSDIDLVLPPGIMETLKNPIENSSMGLGPDAAGGGIVCTRVDASPEYLPQYSSQDMPHDFSSGNESSKLLRGIGPGQPYEEPVTSLLPVSYMSMSQGLLHDDECNAGATELRPTNNTAGATGGYIKPTQMKTWSTPIANNANTLPICNPPTDMAMAQNGYVPVQVLQARNTPALPASAASPVHLLNTSNYVQVSDLQKLKPLVPTAAAATAAAALAAAPPTTTTSVPPVDALPLLPSGFGYTTMEQLQHNGFMKPSAAASAALSNTQAAGHNGQGGRLPPNIGGYVTPQDLNAIAHNRHML